MTTPGTGQAATRVDPAHARQVLPPDADRATWLGLRRTGLGGSETAALVGLSRYSSRWSLWMDKTGRLPLQPQTGYPSDAARWGTLLEPVVREEFARTHGLSIRPVGMLRSQRWPWMLANPDGLCSDRAGYEGKTTSAYLAHEWSQGQVPDHAELQAQWCMAVTGLDRWHVVGLIGGQRELHRVVERSDALIEHLVETSRRFWLEHVQADAEPDVDGSPATAELLAARHPTAEPDTVAEIDPAEADTLLSELTASEHAKQQATEHHDQLKNRVRALIGDRERLTDGTRCVATWRSTDRYAHTRLTAEHPELVANYTRTEQRSVLDTDALRADHPDIAERYRVRQLRIATHDNNEEDHDGT